MHLCALMCVFICWNTYAKQRICMALCIYRRPWCSYIFSSASVHQLTCYFVVLSVWLIFFFLLCLCPYVGVVMYYFASTTYFIHPVYSTANVIKAAAWKWSAFAVLLTCSTNLSDNIFSYAKNANERKKCLSQISTFSFLCDLICSGLFFSSFAITFASQRSEGNRLII